MVSQTHLLTLSTLLLSASLANAAKAQAQISASPSVGPFLVESIQFRGTGCPGGHGQAFSSLDGNRIEISLPSYSVASDPRRAIVRKSCNFILKVPGVRDFRPVVKEVRLRAYNRIVNNGRAQIQLEVFFPGESGRLLTKDLHSHNRGSITVRQGLVPEHATECGVGFVLRANTSAVLNNSGHQAAGTIDLTGSTRTGSVSLHLDWERCRGNS